MPWESHVPCFNMLSVCLWLVVHQLKCPNSIKQTCLSPAFCKISLICQSDVNTLWCFNDGKAVNQHLNWKAEASRSSLAGVCVHKQVPNLSQVPFNNNLFSELHFPEKLKGISQAPLGRVDVTAHCCQVCLPIRLNFHHCGSGISCLGNSTELHWALSINQQSFSDNWELEALTFSYFIVSKCILMYFNVLKF